MPEGDSIHRLARELAPVLLDKGVRSLWLPRQLNDGSTLEGATMVGVEARGKNLLVHFEPGLSLHVHLKMWGRVFIGLRERTPRSAGPDTVAVLETDTHRVRVAKAPIARLLRTRDLVRDPAFRGLGPDLLGESFALDEALTRLTRRTQQPLGEALLDQSVVAGIGNVWKSELCFNLRLDPFAPVRAFAPNELRELLTLARTQMLENVAHKPRKLPDPFTSPAHVRRTRLGQRLGQRPSSVYEREGEPCYDCGTAIVMRRQGESLRSTYLCPRCQPARSAA